MVANQGEVKEKILSEELKQLPFVKSVTSIAGILPQGISESILPRNLTSKMHTQNYARIILDLSLESESQVSFDGVNQIKNITEKYYGKDIYLLGSTPATQDIKKIILSDYKSVNLISMLGVALTALISFRSAILALSVMIPIKIAILVNMALPYLYNNNFTFLGYLMVSSMQLGATVDYAILLSNNYLIQRRELKKSKIEAAKATVQHSLPSILTSAAVLTATGYGIYFLISINSIKELGELIGRGAFFSFIFVIFLLPSLLIITDGLRLKERKLVNRLFSKK